MSADHAVAPSRLNPPAAADPNRRDPLAATAVCPACTAPDAPPYVRLRDVEYATSDESYTYRRCTACGVLFIAPPPVEQLATIYPSTYYAAHASAAGSALQRAKEWADVRLFRRLLAAIPGSRLRALDVGGGTGWLLSLLRRADPRVAETHEVDRDDSGRSAAESHGHVFHGVPVEDFHSDRRFDVVLMLNVIEHVADPVAVLRTVAGALAPHGRILVKTPNTATLDHRLFRRAYWGGYHCPRHWVLFTAENFARAAQRAGLAVVWIRYTQGAPQWTLSVLGSLAARGWIDVSPRRPLHEHPLAKPLMAAAAALDFARRPFMRTAQMFILLRRADDAS